MEEGPATVVTNGKLPDACLMPMLSDTQAAWCLSIDGGRAYYVCHIWGVSAVYEVSAIIMKPSIDWCDILPAIYDVSVDLCVFCYYVCHIWGVCRSRMWYTYCYCVCHLFCYCVWEALMSCKSTTMKIQKVSGLLLDYWLMEEFSTTVSVICEVSVRSTIFIYETCYWLK